ncbi:MAG: MmgE/PrpD family protein [Pseudomonadota bacterium]|nr:MmgE/PrpD family protein [Pseudomonadota bacterium]
MNPTDMTTSSPTSPTSATDPNGPTGRLATWLADLKLDDVPQSVRERAKYLTLDGLACAIVGAQLPWSRTAVDAVTRLEGPGNSTIIGWGRKISAPAAALLNGTFIQGFELDDYHPLAPLHSASLVLPSLLACAETQGKVSGAKFLLGAIAGFEVGPRVGLALHGAEMLSRGWHSGSVFGTHAAAAAAAKILDLDAARVEDALGLAGTQSCGLMAAQYEAMSKRMHHGFSARNGLYAAVLAAGGYTGIKRVFEREYGGFLSTFGEGHSPDASQIADGLGQRWETERIVVKPYAAMAGLHSPLDALFEINARRPLLANEIELIEVELSHAVYHHGWWELERPLTPVGAQMNVGYALAVAVIDGAAMVRQFAPQRINRDDVWSLIPRIRVRHNEEFDKLGPAGRGQSRVRVSFKDGSQLEVYRASSRSMAQLLTADEIVAKFRTLTNGLIEPARQSEILRAVQSLEELPDIAALIELLAPQVRPVFE